MNSWNIPNNHFVGILWFEGELTMLTVGYFP